MSDDPVQDFIDSLADGNPAVLEEQIKNLNQEGLSTSDIARTLEIPEYVVKALLYRHDPPSLFAPIVEIKIIRCYCGHRDDEHFPAPDGLTLARACSDPNCDCADMRPLP